MQVSFPELTDLELWRHGETPTVVPDSFLGVSIVGTHSLKGKQDTKQGQKGDQKSDQFPSDYNTSTLPPPLLYYHGFWVQPSTETQAR